MMGITAVFLFGIILWIQATSIVDARRLPWLGSNTNSISARAFATNTGSTESLSTIVSLPRGGDSEEEEENDEERYSRQVYTMGARAHGLIRSSTIYVDGPTTSGLLWESLKNLALSGVGKIVLVDHQDTTAEQAYHKPQLDDLGKMYIASAKQELKESNTKDSDNEIDELAKFLRLLNPALDVSVVPKEKLLETEIETNAVLLCVDRPYAQQKEWNDWCRQEQPTKFVSAETAGVYGKIFCDFGNHEIHDLDGETPLVVPLDKVQPVDTDKDDSSTVLLVKSVDGERHDVSRDDIVVFQRSDGSTMDLQCTVTKVHSPERIEVKIENSRPNQVDEINAQAVTFSRQKQIQEVSFLSLEESLQEANCVFNGTKRKFPASEIFTPCDLDKSFDETRKKAVFECFQELDNLASNVGNAKIDNTGITEEEQKHRQNFFKTCAAKFVPLQAIFGAIASQECLKAVSGLYNPIQQFLLYDCDEVLTEHKEQADDSTGMSYILGSETFQHLEKQKLFVVGCGAIGCEILKNIAAMGAGTKGKVVITDMDTIEKSNLSRQLLFRDSDIGKFKSKAAADAVFRMTNGMDVESHTSKVGEDEEDGPFDWTFWSKKVDVVLNALDNMEARLFMDEQCVTYQKALVDAGTLGSKGNVQVVVPYKSESYGSSVDPPEPAIPVCTLKNFPYAISHTIQWGRDLFDGLFVRRPNQANQYAQEFLSATGIDIEGLIQKIDQDANDEVAAEVAKELSQDLSMMIGDRDSDDAMKKMAIEWAIQLGKELFYETIVELLEEHPIDELDDEGEPFWSGSRKPPKPLSFSSIAKDDGDDDVAKRAEEINSNMIDFVRSAARLRYETYTGIPSNTRTNLGIVSKDDAKDKLTETTDNFEASPRNDDDSKSKRDAIREKLSHLVDFSSTANDMEVSPIFSAEFEKDDDSNDHITFITAASNLRAICYGIAPVDAMETRKVAGKIVPAMITTTAFVSALSCLELVKLTQGLPLHRHRNAFINLALPFFAFTAPLPAEEFAGVRGETHTLWDKIAIKEGKKAAKKGGMTLKQFLRKIQKKAYAEDPNAVQVSNISIGPIMVYANFLHEDDEELLDKSVWQVIEDALQSGEEFDEEFSRDGPTTSDDDATSVLSVASTPYIDLVVSVEDTETFDEVELPQVRLFRSK